MDLLERENLTYQVFERYRLDVTSKYFIPVGILFCYLFATSRDVVFEHATLTGESEEIGSGFSLLSIDKTDKDIYFTSPKQLALVFSLQSLVSWQLEVLIGKDSFSILGEKDSSVINVFYDKGVSADYLSVLKKVEYNLRSYQFMKEIPL